MSEFLERISKLSPQRLALLADELNERLQTAEKSRRVPLAIVGIGCNLPGGVHGPDEFWQLLADGVDAVGEVPAARWNSQELYDRNPATPGKMATRWGGFIQDPDQFDPKFFGIAPAEAISMDPQQRLLLEASWEALEHAGIAPSQLAGTSTGVFVGLCNGDYSQLALNSPREKITPYFAPGLSHAIAAGRISYVLGLQGPSLAIDTSCSASLVAVHLACQSLRLGECNLALAGGVNLILNPDITIALSQSRMMAPDGRCKAFSDLADGFVRGEGCAMILLKRLPDAIRDRNRILAVIRGSACNQDGRSSGLTAPNGPSQEAVVTAALADAGLHPGDVDYIEAHGTGTSLGDPIELGALNAVFAGSGRGTPLLVGSVKTNLGHLESAAGIAGLIKLVLSIQHGKIPASLHFEKPNSRIEWDRLPIKIPTMLQSWPRHGTRRVGGVSSFGFSGTNAHVIVEEYLPDGHQAASPTAEFDLASSQAYLFALSAKTNSALKSVAARLQHHLRENSSVSLADVAHTLNRGRSHFEFRAAVVAASHAELLQALGPFANTENSNTIQHGRVLGRSPRVAFIFGAQNSNLPKVGKQLYENSTEFREAIERCDRIVGKDLGGSLISLLYGNDTESAALGRSDLPAWYGPVAAFSVQYALAELWLSCGVQPSLVFGYGIGEYVAGCIAGVFSLQDGLRLAMCHGHANPSELISCVNSVGYSAPQIHFVPNSTVNVGQAAAVGSAEYWSRSSGAAAPSRDALASIAYQHCVAYLWTGDSAEFEQFDLQNAAVLQTNGLPSFDPREKNDRQFLHTAAALYVLGCNLDWSGFPWEAAANTISLPTYPFEKERYWLDPVPDTRSVLSSSSTDNKSSSLSPVGVGDAPTVGPQTTEEDAWVYDLAWESKPLGDRGQSIASMDERWFEQMAITPASSELQRVEQLMGAITPVYATYIMVALQQAGLSPLSDAPFTLEELSRRLKIAPTRQRLLARLLAILVEDRVLERKGDSFRFVDFRPRPDGDSELQKLGAEFPECLTEVNILRRCGKKLSAVLQGTYDPMQLVFADGSTGEIEQIYELSPVCRFFNDKAAKVVRASVDQLNGRPARILEIGGGTGATTVSILSELRGRNIEYDFTDVSKVFLSRARVKFAETPSIRYQVLDIEKDPIEQDFEPAGYDIILAANVLHTTADLRQTLAHVRTLLKPGGLVLLVEGIRPDRWLDLTLGLTDGWRRFRDLDLRPEHPLVSSDTWAQLFREGGLGGSHTIAYRNEAGSSSQQVLIVAQDQTYEMSIRESRRTSGKQWIVLADDSGVGAALSGLFTAAGESCEMIRRPQSADEIATTIQGLQLQRGLAPVEIVYLWSIDVAEPIASLAAAEEVCCKTLIDVMQAMLKPANENAHIWIATRGAQATEHFSPSVAGALQSLAWGIGRVFGLEAPKHYRKLIDLDPRRTPEDAAQDMMFELLADDAEDQIAYRDGARLAARLKRSHLDPVVTYRAHGIREDGSYLMVGGLGGVGLRLAKWIAEQRPGHLVLLSRTGIGKRAGDVATERLRAIQEIEDLGVGVTVVEGDVASESDMRLLFDRFGTEFPPLRGVLHAATVVSAAEIGDLTGREIDAMLRPKVLGTWVLHQLTKKLNLNFFLVFSSAASLLGAKSLAHYAAANQFLDSFAHTRRANGLPMLSVNWGAWDTMRTEGINRMSQTGLLPMSTATLLNLFRKLIATECAQVMIANVDWDVLKPVFEVNRMLPLLENFGNVVSKPERIGSASASSSVSLQVVAGMAPEEREKFIEAFVLEQAAQVLGFRHGELPAADAPLIDLGLDSLMAVDLKNRLQSALGQELSPTVVFDYPSVSEIADFLETRLWVVHSANHDLATSQKDEIVI